MGIALGFGGIRDFSPFAYLCWEKSGDCLWPIGAYISLGGNRIYIFNLGFSHGFANVYIRGV